MFRLIPIFLLLSITCNSQETQKRILFHSDSIWYAGENQLLFSSTDKGVSWDTIFAKRNPQDTVFFMGVLDTATNVFISDQRTLFVFGWDGTMHRKTILYSSSDGGKMWSKTEVYNNFGVLGVKNLHMISPTQFFLERRRGHYATTLNAGKTWKMEYIIQDTYSPGKYSCADELFTFHTNGNITYSYSPGTKCKSTVKYISHDGGLTWVLLEREAQKPN
jgi:hypothetical protein